MLSQEQQLATYTGHASDYRDIIFVEEDEVAFNDALHELVPELWYFETMPYLNFSKIYQYDRLQDCPDMTTMMPAPEGYTAEMRLPPRQQADLVPRPRNYDHLLENLLDQAQRTERTLA